MVVVQVFDVKRPTVGNQDFKGSELVSAISKDFSALSVEGLSLFFADLPVGRNRVNLLHIFDHDAELALGVADLDQLEEDLGLEGVALVVRVVVEQQPVGLASRALTR
jgi:hypothetical protein